MRVFILCTGRTGSKTFSKAAAHATNFTSGHETRSHLPTGRLDYPDHHIEADNRLSWFTGSLARRFPDAYYVHLTRSEAQVHASYRKRFIDTWSTRDRFMDDLRYIAGRKRSTSIVNGFAHAILHRKVLWDGDDLDEVVQLYIDTVNDNIAEFLSDRPHMDIDLATISRQFPEFWQAIGAEGDLAAAVRELSIRHNAS